MPTNTRINSLKKSLCNTKWIITLATLYIASVTSILSYKDTSLLNISFYNNYVIATFSIFTLILFTIKSLSKDIKPYINGESVCTATILTLITTPYAGAFASFKQSINTMRPFEYDLLLYEADKTLHFNTSPWEIFSFLFNHKALIHSIDILYVAWFLFLLCFCYWMFWSKDNNLRQRFFLTTFFVWSFIGSGLGFIFSSAGPCYLKHIHPGINNPYTELFGKLYCIHNDDKLWAIVNQEKLWNSFVTHTWLPFGGISAMPSVHVAMATVFALVLWYRSTFWGTLGWVYLIIIQIGSIVLGWHYAIDGYISFILTLFAWKITGMIAARAAP